MPKTMVWKREIIATRVTPKIKKLIVRECMKEGINISEWFRSAILNELKRRDILRDVYCKKCGVLLHPQRIINGYILCPECHQTRIISTTPL